jgi:hypothetical protein
MGLFDFVSDAILSFAREIVQGVMSQITQQLSIITDAVESPIKNMVQQVVGGVWKGRGSEAFVNEINSVVFPLIAGCLTGVTGVNTNINKAMDIMDQAENAVTGIVGEIADVFGGIF